MIDENRPVPGKKYWRLFLWAAISVFLLFSAAAAAVVCLLFAPWQEIPPEIPSAADFRIQSRIWKLFFAELQKERPAGAKIVLVFTPEEVNSLLKLAGNAEVSKYPYPVRYLQPKFFDNGEFEFTVPVRTSAAWLRGGTIYLKARIKFSKNKQEIRCRMINVGTEKFTFDGSIVQSTVDKEIEKFKSSADFRNLDSIIESINFDEKSRKLTVVCYADGLRR